MGAQTYETFREPVREALVARNRLFLKALAEAYPVTAHDLVRGKDQLRSQEHKDNLAIIENHVERLIDRVASNEQPKMGMGEDFAALKAAKIPTSSADHIINECCIRHGVSGSEIVSQSRRKHIVRARQEAMYLIYDNTTLSLPRIGHKLGGRDHTTVLHGCRAHAKRTGAPDVVAARREAS